MDAETKEYRRGMFTASEMHRLMGGSAGYATCEFTTEHTCYERVKIGDSFEYVPMQEAHKTKKCWKRDNSFLPEGAISYVLEKCGEILDTYRSEGFKTAATNWGNEWELTAIAEYERRTGFTLSNTGDEQFFFNNGEYGATPDGVVFNNDFMPIIVVDTKCPMAHTHIFNLLFVKTWQDLKKHYPEYFYQSIGQLLCTGAIQADWVSYRPTMDNDHCYHKITINRYEVADDIELLQKRLNLAVARKHEFLQQIEKMNNECT